jgi:hypothetical protein
MHSTFWKYKVHNVAKIESHSIKHKSSQLDIMKHLIWSDCGLHNHRRVGETKSPTTRSHPDLLEPVTKGQNSGVKMGGQRNVKNFEVHKLWDCAVPVWHHIPKDYNLTKLRDVLVQILHSLNISIIWYKCFVILPHRTSVFDCKWKLMINEVM